MSKFFISIVCSCIFVCHITDAMYCLHLTSSASSCQPRQKQSANNANDWVHRQYARSYPLHCAAQEGDFERTKALLSSCRNIDNSWNNHSVWHWDYDGFNPLHRAIESGHLEIVEAFIAAGANVNEPTNVETIMARAHKSVSVTPLLMAIQRNAKNCATRNQMLALLGAQHPRLGMKSPFKFFSCDVYQEIFECLNYYDCAIVKALIGAGADVDEHEKDGTTLLHKAAMSGCIGLARVLIDSGVGCDRQTIAGYTPLYLAVRHDQLAMVKFLVNVGADSKKLTLNGDTLLHVVNRLDIAQILIVAGVDVNRQNNQGDTPLHNVVGRRMNSQTHELVQALLRAGADLEKQNQRGQTPLDVAKIAGNRELVQVLLSAGACVVSKASTIPTTIPQASDWSTPLHRAVQAGCFEYVTSLLLSQPHTINRMDYDGFTPLHIAALNGDVAVTAVLIGAGANPHFKGINGKTPLQLAREKGHEKVALLLICAMYPLHAAVKSENLEKINGLIRTGVHINQLDNEGRTPLHIGIMCGNVAVIKALIAAGADSNQLYRGNNLLTMAICCGTEHVVKALIDAGANVNLPDNNGLLPLHLAIKQGNLEIMRTLIAAGAVIHTTDNAGQTPLNMAIDRITNHSPSKLWGHNNQGQQQVSGCTTRNQMLALLGARHPRLGIKSPFNLFSCNVYQEIFECLNYYDCAIVKAIIAAGANVNELIYSGRAPLHQAARHARLSLVQTLIDAGADPNLPDLIGVTPLHVALDNRWPAANRQDIAQALIKAGANNNQPDKSGMTPMNMTQISAGFFGGYGPPSAYNSYQFGSGYPGAYPPPVFHPYGSYPPQINNQSVNRAHATYVLNVPARRERHDTTATRIINNRDGQTHKQRSARQTTHTSKPCCTML